MIVLGRLGPSDPKNLEHDADEQDHNGKGGDRREAASSNIGREEADEYSQGESEAEA